MRDDRDWYIEVCAVCGCQLGPGIGSRTRTGRCTVEAHHSVGGIVVRVIARPLNEQGPNHGGVYLRNIAAAHPGLVASVPAVPQSGETQ